MEIKTLFSLKDKLYEMFLKHGKKTIALPKNQNLLNF